MNNVWIKNRAKLQKIWGHPTTLDLFLTITKSLKC